MPHLMVNLEDVSDCEKAVNILQRRICRHGGGPKQGGPKRRGEGRGQRADRHKGDEESSPAGPGGGQRVNENASLTLPQKLKRIQHRGMWKHLLKIAQNAQEPLSLPELDELLELPKNKMRSLKANMAKLENRFALKFLKVDPDAGVDAAGNPRYIMPQNVRRQIKRLEEA